MKTEKIYTYPKSLILKDSKGNVLLTIITQLYEIGVYVAMYHSGKSMPTQLNLTPILAVKHMKQFTNEKNLIDKTMKVEVGPIIKVKEENGLFVEV